MCVVAWMRLEKINPRWADLIYEEFWTFQATWFSNAFKNKYGGGNVGDKWMRDAFQYMLRTQLKKGQKPLFRPRILLHDYAAFMCDITKIKKDNPGISKKPSWAQETFWREKLQGILDRLPYHDATRTHAKVTPAMIEKARMESPSAVAFEILHHLHGVGPTSLKKKVFPKLRKPQVSPLELWREAGKSPRT